MSILHFRLKSISDEMILSSPATEMPFEQWKYYSVRERDLQSRVIGILP